jgi:hypothetical protein
MARGRPYSISCRESKDFKREKTNTMEKYKRLWLALVNVGPEGGYSFNELIDADFEIRENYDGAWGNLLLKADTINEALAIIPLGLAEKKFVVQFIESIVNLQSLVEQEEVNRKVVEEADWLLASDFIFMISDKLFPYTDDTTES